MSTATATRPDTAKATDTGWAEIPKASKPSKVVSADGMRPVLQHGYVRHTDNGSFLYATDSYVLVEIPITIDAAERDSVLPEIAIPHAALRALDRSKGRFRLFDGLIEIEGEAALFRPGSDKLTAPNFAELIATTESTRGKISAVGFNPSLLKGVAEALGCGRHDGLRAEFIGRLRPIVLTPLSGGRGRALQMPIRLNV